MQFQFIHSISVASVASTTYLHSALYLRAVYRLGVVVSYTQCRTHITAHTAHIHIQIHPIENSTKRSWRARSRTEICTDFY